MVDELKEMLVRMVHDQLHSTVMAWDWIPEELREQIHLFIWRYLRDKAGLDPTVPPPADDDPISAKLSALSQ